MASGQLRLLLWKDYLMRKRNPITVAGILWAIGVISTICIVRFNIDNQDFPTCQFAARALPSAGLLTFLQSFICNVNNECSSMDDFQEIPTFEKSKLTQLKRQLAPLIYNDSVVEIAGSIPDAIKILATLADVADEPKFLDITRNGLHVADLFRNPKRIKIYFVERLNIQEDVVDSIISAQLGLGIMNGKIDTCDADSLEKIIKMDNTEHLSLFVNKLCSITKDELQKILMDLVWEMDIGEFITMAGNMYAKLSDDNGLTKLGEMATAALRMFSIHSFIPPEVNGIIYGSDDNFSYVPLSMINKFINLFQPVFGNTDSYKSVKDFTDSIITGVKFLKNIMKKGDISKYNEKVPSIKGTNNAGDVVDEIFDGENNIDAFNIMARITNLLLKFLSKKQNHDVLLYSTLLSKFIEVADKMVEINTNIEQLIYDVSLRNPKGIRVLLGLPLSVVTKGLDGLADPERAQIITSNLENPGQPFCDLQTIQKFFLVPKEEAINLKSRLCSDDWEIYVHDMITSFGTYEAKDNINAIASLFVMSSLGSDVSDKLYTIDKDFEIFKNFTQRIANLDKVKKPELNWDKIFNQETDAEFLKVVKEKESLGKLILLTVHGCLAKKVVKQNTLLELKVSPILKDITTMTVVINDQMKSYTKETAKRAKAKYPELLKVLAMTALDENKTYKSLSTPSEEIFCRGSENATHYLNFPANVDTNDFVDILCDVSIEIQKALKADSVFSQGIAAIKTAKHSMLEKINWTKLIKGLKQLYMTIEDDYPYVLEFRSYGMDKQTQEEIGQLFSEAQDYWFNLKSLKRMVLLAINIGFRALDLLDYEAFGLNQDFWLKIKYYLAIVTGPFDVINDFIWFTYSQPNKYSVQTDIPKETSAVIYRVMSNLPQLIVESVDVIVRNDVEVDPIINVLNADTWPCYRSLTEFVHFPTTEQVVTSLESLICFNRTFQNEWKEYLEQKNVTLYKTAHWNITTLAPHVFLKFLSVFDRTIDNINAIDGIIHKTFEESDNGSLNLKSAWKYTMDTFNTTEGETILRSFFTKVDSVLNSMETTTPNNLTLNTLWKNYINCSAEVYMNEACTKAGKSAWINLFKYISMVVGNATHDLGTYLKEATGENSTILQVFGFTTKTTLYMMYEKAPELLGVLINSYWDLNFLQQVRRASLTHFWDCEAVLSSLTPGPGSTITEDMLHDFHPLICPSILYWLSMPTGANSLFDVLTKPQYLFFTLHVADFGSVFEQAYVAVTDFSNTLEDLSKNDTKIDLSINNLKFKLKATVDEMISYKIKKDDPSYIAFSKVMKTQIVSSIYLTRTVAIVNKIYDLLSNLSTDDVVTNISDTDKKSIENDITSLTKLFKRRASDIVRIHFDVITDVVWTNRNDYKITNALEVMCNNLKKNDTTKEILGDNPRVRGIICSKQYKIIYNAVQHVMDDDFADTKNSLLNIVTVLKENTDNMDNIFTFFNENEPMVKALKKSTKYASELDISIYLKYLESNIEHYSVVLKFLSGNDWWKELRNLYSGVKSFFDSAERSFEITNDILNNLDKIHLVRLFRDTNVNDTESFCQPNMTLSDYIPDGTGLLSTLHRQLCGDKLKLFREIPPLLFASQGYEDSLKIQPTINYHQLNIKLSSAETSLPGIFEEVQSPTRPEWVSDENIANFRSAVLNLLSKETLTKIAFSMMSNFVDGSTLYLNETYCEACSQVTSWVKQITLQLFKKQEYEDLFCTIQEMSPDQLHYVIKNTFHWDMAIGELISVRNYTKYELNKSLNEFLEQVKLNLLEEMNRNSSTLECLAPDSDNTIIGQVSLICRILSGLIRMFTAELIHLQEVDGFTTLPYILKLQAQIASHIEVPISLEEIKKEKAVFDDLYHMKKGSRIPFCYLDLNEVNGFPLQKSMFKCRNLFCEAFNCTEVISDVNSRLNHTKIEEMLHQLPELQTKEFWRFQFIADILEPIEQVLKNVDPVLRVLSKMDSGVMEGKLTPMIDFIRKMLIHDNLNSFVLGIVDILYEMTPLLHNTILERDILALTGGLGVLYRYKENIITQDFNITLSGVFKNPENIEASLKDIGVNNTSFWKIAESLQNGKIRLGTLMSQSNSSIKTIMCDQYQLSQILIPSELNDFTSDEFYSAITDQFCEMPDGRARKIVPILIENINISFVFDRVKSFLLNKLYAASNVTAEEGNTLFSRVSDMATLLPLVQQSVANVTNSLANEPLIQRLKNGFSIGGFMSSPETMAEVGNMMCGKPFYSGVSRFYKSIVNSIDLSSKPDEEQLRALPTDFCRSVYTDIVSMEGGKIVWSFIKPLLMGKILYTPHHSAVQRIIEKANSTFSPMVKMFNLVHSFAQAFSSIDKMSTHKAGLKALQHLLSAEEIRITLLGNVSMPQINVDELISGIDTEGLGRLLTKSSDLIRCINLDRFKAVTDEKKLTEEAARLTRINEFTAGLVFLNMSSNADDIPRNIEYKIRMDIENVPTTKRTKNYLWTPGPEASFLENMRYFRGFIQIQDIVEKAIIQQSASRRSKRQVSVLENWEIYTQQNPYPCYRKDLFQTSLYESQSLIVAFFFSFLFIVTSAVRFILTDKESGNTMLMSVMGVNLSYHTLSWFLSSLVEITITMALVSCVLYYGQILPHTTPTLVFTLLFIFGLSVLSFCYLMGKLFKSASVGAICAALGYLTTFMPFILILSLEAVLTSSLKIFVSLSMSSSLCYAFLFICRFEAMGVGAGWSQVWDSIDNNDMNIGIAAAMMIFDACLYFLMGYLVEKFWGLKKVQSNVTNIASTDEKAGVSIINITKVYSRGAKPALSGVNVELRPGQVTTLLGHNGAGKSTLINILTGMLKPTSGQVVIRSGSSGSTKVGVCPQRDILYEHMTAREHVYLYAKLNNALSTDVDSILKVVSLGHVCDEMVSRLSGGTRRRLCVALAFVGQPNLVTLDEPTSGVDPQARREIWCMIMKLRANRTILLTTHHLDEAELLSDQVVIMHKGEVHTTGSPIDIKRTLGSGYKLTITYPESQDIEEKTRQALELTRSIVKNASLIDVAREEVEINVPFFDEHGVSTDFEALCSSIEEGSRRLGYQNYSMECTSLEQVFFNICHQDKVALHHDSSAIDTTSKSASTSSIKADSAPLVLPEGPLKGSASEQFLALLFKRYTHYLRNRWLLFLLLVLPSLFVIVAMGFATIRPPADNEVSLKLTPALYEPTTDYLISRPSNSLSNINLASQIMDILRKEQNSRNWTEENSLTCECADAIQHCKIPENVDRPNMMLLPDVNTLNAWLVTSEQLYIEKRYGGYSSSLSNNVSQLLSWYNNKGHHAMPAYLNHLNEALLKASVGNEATLTLYTHPLKISNEQLNKDNVYQHIADAGISVILVIGYSLVSAGAAIYLVTERTEKQKRLQLLCGVSPTIYWSNALLCDMMVILVNLAITVVILKIFNFPVFVARNNLPAICVLIILYGYACAGVVYVLEKLFTEASLANMILFCGNTFVAVSGIAILLVLDIISDSDAMDHARWVLHKILLLSPQFVLGDGLLEIAKNTIQYQVLGAFGMDTYRDPLSSNLVLYHYISLLAIGTALFILNLVIEYGCFDALLTRFTLRYTKPRNDESLEEDVLREERRVSAAVAPLRLRTIGNINAGFVDSKEDLKSNSLKRSTLSVHESDVISCLHVSKLYPAVSGFRVAVDDLTLGIPPSECTALLGQNGAGKSSTFGMLTAELRPSAGQIYIQDRAARQRDLCQGRISYCPQRDALDSLLTVRETLQLFCKLRGLTNHDEVIKRTLEQFELTKYTNNRSGVLSGGNKRKLCTAVAFMGRNPLILLDEPTSGMDPGSRACVSRAWLSACNVGRAVLLSTHALHDARRAHRVALLRDGKLCALAPLDRSLARFGGGYVVCARVCEASSSMRTLWGRVLEHAPHATLTAAHATAIHFIVPTLATLGDKEIETRVSDVFRVMSSLQRDGLLEDFTLNQTSLEQMFLNCTGNAGAFNLDPENEYFPSPSSRNRRDSDELSVVTAL